MYCLTYLYTIGSVPVCNLCTKGSVLTPEGMSVAKRTVLFCDLFHLSKVKIVPQFFGGFRNYFVSLQAKNKIEQIMNATSLNNLWSYIQGLSLTASNRKWLAERLIEPIKKETPVPPVSQTWEEAMSDLDESEREFECGDVLSGDGWRTTCSKASSEVSEEAKTSVEVS